MEHSLPTLLAGDTVEDFESAIEQLEKDKAELVEAIKDCVNELCQWQVDYDDFDSAEFISKKEELLERMK